MKIPKKVHPDKVKFLAGKMEECKSLDDATFISAQWAMYYLSATGTTFKVDEVVQKFRDYLDLIIDRIPNVSEEKPVTIGFPGASK